MLHSKSRASQLQVLPPILISIHHALLTKTANPTVNTPTPTGPVVPRQLITCVASRPQDGMDRAPRRPRAENTSQPVGVHESHPRVPQEPGSTVLYT